MHLVKCDNYWKIPYSGSIKNTEKNTEIATEMQRRHMELASTIPKNELT
jgi:hypothetical protein